MVAGSGFKFGIGAAGAKVVTKPAGGFKFGISKPKAEADKDDKADGEMLRENRDPAP